METGRRSKGASKLTPEERAEQREKLVNIIDEAIEGQWMPDALLHGISAAGFSIVGPGEPDELINRIANAIALTAGDPWFDYRPHAKAVLESLKEQSG